MTPIEYVTQWSLTAETKPVYATYVQCQPGGVTGYARGGPITATPGKLSINGLKIVFSDRIVSGQPFSLSQADISDLVCEIFDGAPDGVRLTMTSVTWGGSWQADAQLVDADSLLTFYSVPGAGAGAPSATAFITFSA